jgi:hypothetical protein
MQADIIRDEVRNPQAIATQKTATDACCNSVLLTTCCQPSQKESCCGADRPVDRAVDHQAAPRTCGCSSSNTRGPR